MKKNKYIALLLSITLLASLTLQAMASNADQKTYSASLFQSATSINEAVESIDSYENLNAYVEVMRTLSDDALVTMIGNSELSGFARKLAVEVYSARIVKESNQAGVLAPMDTRLVAMVQDSEFDENIKAEIVVFFNSFFVTDEAQAAITACTESSNDYLAVQSLKAMKKYDWQGAEVLADAIIDNYANESDSKVNIALKLKTYAMEQKSAAQRSAQGAEAAFAETCEEIYVSATSAKMQRAAETALKAMGVAMPATEREEPLRIVDRTGYAAFRDGAFLGINWHSGVIVDIEGSDEEFAHAQLADQTGYGDYDEFLESTNNTPQGYYWTSHYSATTARRANVQNKAAAIAEAAIGYTATMPILYEPLFTGTQYAVENITAIRCDGVTEYAFEYYGYQLFGSGTYWNITLPAQSNQEAHSNMTPKKQAATMLRIGGLR